MGYGTSIMIPPQAGVGWGGVPDYEGNYYTASLAKGWGLVRISDTKKGQMNSVVYFTRSKTTASHLADLYRKIARAKPSKTSYWLAEINPRGSATTSGSAKVHDTDDAAAIERLIKAQITGQHVSWPSGIPSKYKAAEDRVRRKWLEQKGQSSLFNGPAPKKPRREKVSPWLRKQRKLRAQSKGGPKVVKATGPKPPPAKKTAPAARGDECSSLTLAEVKAGWRLWYVDLHSGKHTYDRRECYRSKEHVKYVVTAVKPGGRYPHAIRWFTNTRAADKYAKDLKTRKSQALIMAGRGLEALYRDVKVRQVKEVKATKAAKAKPAAKTKAAALPKKWGIENVSPAQGAATVLDLKKTIGRQGLGTKMAQRLTDVFGELKGVQRWHLDSTTQTTKRAQLATLKAFYRKHQAELPVYLSGDLFQLIGTLERRATTKPKPAAKAKPAAKVKPKRTKKPPKVKQTGFAVETCEMQRNKFTTLDAAKAAAAKTGGWIRNLASGKFGGRP